MNKELPNTTFIGIDAGATKTHAVLVSAGDDILAEAFGPPVSMSLMMPEEAWARLRAVIVDLSGRQPAGSVITGIHAGIPGCFSPVLRAGLQEAARNNPLPESFPAPTFDTDCRIALAAAIPDGPGLLLVAGTGSSIYGRNAKGEERLFGGWGHLLGDRGSAFSVGLDALEHCCRVEDGMGTPTSLSAAILEAWSLTSMREVVTVVYGSEFKSRIASLAPLVAEEARRGDGAAVAIYRKAGESLAELALAAIKGLDLLDCGCRIALTGSLWNAGALIHLPFSETLAHSAPDLTVFRSDTPAAMGAARLAKTALH